VTYPQSTMPYRFTPFVNNHYYHIFNRGVERRPMFTNKREYDRFFLAMSYYRFSKPPIKLSMFLSMAKTRRESLIKEMNTHPDILVTIIAYALMPNHFHILLRQEQDGGIRQFLSKLTNSYSKYYNTKHNRVGPLIQGPFKAILVESDEQLIHVSRYIHLNPVVSAVIEIKQLTTYPYTSLPSYTTNKNSIVDTGIILGFFKKPSLYHSFLLDQIDYAKKLNDFKHLTIDDED
jgi:putative transposase